ncbi:MAG TPA: TIGR02391 family protein [Dehalococcoidales bacterium]|nr:TIGR02391 family protein [Dehalococcoidales bacterium]
MTRRGAKLAEESDIAGYVRSNLIPKQSLDPVLADKVWPLFIRGDYDTAVFQAFKEVEIRARTAAYLSPESYGTSLMRDAFHPENGVLTDSSLPSAERQTTSDLFAVAIGLFKNPASHRDVDWNDPVECAELIYLANHLLRMVEKHADEECSRA